MTYHEPIESDSDPLFCVCGLSMEYHLERSTEWLMPEERTEAEKPLDGVSMP
jgi:hypothetical protein